LLNLFAQNWSMQNGHDTTQSKCSNPDVVGITSSSSSSSSGSGSESTAATASTASTASTAAGKEEADKTDRSSGQIAPAKISFSQDYKSSSSGVATASKQIKDHDSKKVADNGSKKVVYQTGVPKGVGYVSNFLPAGESSRLFDKFVSELAWETQEREGRPTALYGDDDVDKYEYARNSVKPLSWTPDLLLLKRAVESHTGFKYDVCLCNLYPNGTARFKPHADREELKNPTPIAVISLGAERPFEFQPMSPRPGDYFRTILGNGSLLTMLSHVHETHVHSLPPHPLTIKPRISITFRSTKTAIQKPTTATETATAPATTTMDVKIGAIKKPTTAPETATALATATVGVKIGKVLSLTAKTRVGNIYKLVGGVPAGSVKVLRPSKWGNPFPIVNSGPLHLRVSRSEAISKYRAWIVKQPHLLKDLHELKGKLLLCCCSPNPCHAEILAQLADAS